jgi:hypothetical protein
MKQLALIIPIMIAATVLSACNTTPEELGSNMATPKTTTAAKAAPKVTTQGVTTRFQCPPFCIDPFGWQQSSPTTVDALLQIDAAKDKDGFPVIAKITWTPFWTSPVEVRHWTGNTWESLPNLLLEHQAQGVALAVTKAKLGNGTIDETIFGQPYVATIGENRITVHTWIGGEWVQTGGFLNVPGRTYPMGQPAIAVRPNGNPVVAWRTTSNLIAVSEWDETAWKTSYVNDNQTTLAKSDPSLALTSDGAPVVAYVQTNTDENQIAAIVRFSQNDSWNTYAQPILPNQSFKRVVAGFEKPQITVDQHNNPIVAFRRLQLRTMVLNGESFQTEIAHDVYVVRGGIGRWENLGAYACGGPPESVMNYSLSVQTNDTPVLLCAQRIGFGPQNPYVLMTYLWNGTAWGNRGGRIESSGSLEGYVKILNFGPTVLWTWHGNYSTNLSAAVWKEPVLMSR